MHSVDEEGWRFVAFVRLVPIIPYNVMNYLLGLTRIPFHHYMIATVVFMAPSTVAYTWIGHASREAIAGDTDNIHYALIALGLLVAMIFLPRFYKRWRGSKQPLFPELPRRDRARLPPWRRAWRTPRRDRPPPGRPRCRSRSRCRR